jgi:hypothetical protein
MRGCEARRRKTVQDSTLGTRHSSSCLKSWSSTSRSGALPVSLSARGLATVGGPNLGLGAKAYRKFTRGVELNERPIVIEQIVHDLGELIGKGRDILVAVQPAPTMLVSVAELIVLNVHGDLVLLQLVPGACRSITLQEAWRASGCRQPARPFRRVGSVKPDAVGPVTGPLVTWADAVVATLFSRLSTRSNTFLHAGRASRPRTTPRHQDHRHQQGEFQPMRW